MLGSCINARAMPTRCLFGHYEFVGDSIVVSSVLDDEDVPAFVVDFIMFHELLHKKHGLRWRAGRAMAHTPAFRQDERRLTRDHVTCKS